MPPQHWSDPSLGQGESVPSPAWRTLSHRAEHGIYNPIKTWFYMVCPGRISGPCSHMHHSNTQPVNDNHTVSGHQLHALVKLSHASQTHPVTVLLLVKLVCALDIKVALRQPHPLL